MKCWRASQQAAGGSHEQPAPPRAARCPQAHAVRTSRHECRCRTCRR
jgi:hypothetical protein